MPHALSLSVGVTHTHMYITCHMLSLSLSLCCFVVVDFSILSPAQDHFRMRKLKYTLSLTHNTMTDRMRPLCSVIPGKHVKLQLVDTC